MPPWWALVGLTALAALSIAAYVILALVVIRLSGDLNHACAAISDTRVQLALLDQRAGLHGVPLPPSCQP